MFSVPLLPKPQFGRKQTVDRDKIQALREEGLGATDIARQMKIGGQQYTRY